MANQTGQWNRREWLVSGGIAAVADLGGAGPAQAAPLEMTSRLYESLGVRPFINARGTFTILTGSQSLPAVKQAMTEASRHFVNMDELMDAVGARIAELTKEAAALDRKLADPKLYTGPVARVTELQTERGRIGARLEAAEQTWLEAAAALEAASPDSEAA